MSQYQQYVSMGMSALYALGIVAKLTPTPKDNKWYTKLLKIVRILGLSPENYKNKWGI